MESEAEEAKSLSMLAGSVVLKQAWESGGSVLLSVVGSVFGSISMEAGEAPFLEIFNA